MHVDFEERNAFFLDLRTALSGFVGRLFEENGLFAGDKGAGSTCFMAHLVRFFAFLDSDSSMGSSLW
jgi:hypothetical protein